MTLRILLTTISRLTKTSRKHPNTEMTKTRRKKKRRRRKLRRRKSHKCSDKWWASLRLMSQTRPTFWSKRPPSSRLNSPSLSLLKSTSPTSWGKTPKTKLASTAESKLLRTASSLTARSSVKIAPICTANCSPGTIAAWSQSSRSTGTTINSSV